MAEPFKVHETWSTARIKSYGKGAAGLIAVAAFPAVLWLIGPFDTLDRGISIVMMFIALVLFWAIMSSLDAIHKGDTGFDKPVRLMVFRGGLTIVPDDWGKARLNVSWEQLQSVSHLQDATKRSVLQFNTTDGKYLLKTHFLNQNAEEIIHRIELQLEQSDCHLAAVYGATEATWNVAKSLPYERVKKKAFSALNKPS